MQRMNAEISRMKKLIVGLKRDVEQKDEELKEQKRASLLLKVCAEPNIGCGGAGD
jgi:hypothetical protein